MSSLFFGLVLLKMSTLNKHLFQEGEEQWVLARTGLAKLAGNSVAHRNPTVGGSSGARWVRDDIQETRQWTLDRTHLECSGE